MIRHQEANSDWVLSFTRELTNNSDDIRLKQLSWEDLARPAASACT